MTVEVEECVFVENTLCNGQQVEVGVLNSNEVVCDVCAWTLQAACQWSGSQIVVSVDLHEHICTSIVLFTQS